MEVSHDKKRKLEDFDSPPQTKRRKTIDNDKTNNDNNKQLSPLLIYGYVNDKNFNSPLSKISGITELILLYLFPNLIIDENKTHMLVSNNKNNIHQFYNITLNENSTLTVNDWCQFENINAGTGTLILQCMNKITLKCNSKIDLNGKGYLPTKGPGCGIRGMYTGGCGGGCGDWYETASGASYGTSGEKGVINAYGAGNKLISPGKTYGDKALTTLYLGSGGGDFGYHDEYNSDNEQELEYEFNKLANGGSGGGALQLICNELIMNENTIISCNGTSSTESDCEYGCDDIYDLTGSGSGGSIHLIVGNILIMSESSKIESIGGQANFKGGNGRIRLDILGIDRKKSKYNINCFNPIPFFNNE